LQKPLIFKVKELNLNYANDKNDIDKFSILREIFVILRNDVVILEIYMK